MKFKNAVQEYQKNPTDENLTQQATALMRKMTQQEKFHMLSGHGLMVCGKNNILHKRPYNYEPMPAGGCKRLGIPQVMFTDGPRGVVMGTSTCFPVPSLRAASFDPDLEYRVNKAMATEAIARGANYFGGICINLVRNPRWGRSQESYGEDPVLLGAMGVAATKAVQEEGVIACPKHFALNSMEDLRFFVDVHCSDKTLYEVYLPHFKKCIDAGAMSIMAAYNRYDGTYCCENNKLLTKILRDEWGFTGFVMSDFVWGVHNCERSLMHGCDMEMMMTLHYANLGKVVKNGMLPIEKVDEAVVNILRSLIKVTPKIRPRDAAEVCSKAHTALALEAAEKGTVLLKNNGVLPAAKTAKIAVVGPYADTPNIGANGSCQVYPPYAVSTYQGIKNTFGDSAVCSNSTDLQEALRVSEGCDLVIVTAGFDSNTEGETMYKAAFKMTKRPKNYGGDRVSLHLSREESELIRGLKAAGRKVVVSLFSGNAVLVEEWEDCADAIIMSFYNGLEGGNALAHLIAGEKNFEGKLPFVVARREEDYPFFRGLGELPYTIDYGYYHGYTLLDKEKKEPRYPFGFGLSYTSFAVENAAVEQTADAIKVTASVTNTGKCDGAEVVQVYVGSDNKDVDRPVKLLKGFAKLPLKAGQTGKAEIVIDPKELRFFNDTIHQWEYDPSYTVYVGTDSKNIEKAGTVTFPV